MAQQNALQTAMVDRAVRTIKAELHFLTDMGLVQPNQIATFLRELPQESTPSIVVPLGVQAPTPGMANLSMNEKDTSHNGFYAPPPQSSTPNPVSSPPPPTYTPQPSNGLCRATALYTYNPTDAGDLSLMANDRIVVLEYMNAEWWKGRSERTGETGIFPRSYVRTEEDGSKGAGMGQPQREQQPYMYGQQQQQPQNSGPMSYGNMPVAVAQGQQQDPNAPRPNSKVSEMGKKFGSKLGNAAIFGAGATMGADLVNSIF